jgi:hypothetical protein
MDCGFLARLVAEHRLDEDEARDVLVDLAYAAPKRAYRLNGAPGRMGVVCSRNISRPNAKAAAFCRWDCLALG